ncbi:MAG: hypothetical protein LOY00_16010, partial [Methylocaldum sp.]|nr:hypothetical protein [Methylocaldum sp.]
YPSYKMNAGLKAIWNKLFLIALRDVRKYPRRSSRLAQKYLLSFVFTRLPMLPPVNDGSRRP